MATPIRSSRGFERGRPGSGRGRRPSRSERALAAHRALVALAEAATTGLTSGQMLERVVAAAATLTDGATVHLWLVEDDGRVLRLAAESGARPGKARAPLRPVLKMGEGLAGAIARTRRPIVLASLRGDRRLVNKAWARDQGFVSFAGVPFARAARLLGVLCLFTTRRHRFTQGEVDLLRSFAGHAAVALENATLFDTATSRLRRLEALREIQREISEQRDPEALLGLIGRRASELLDADSATVYLLDEATGLLRPRAWFNIGDWIRDVAIPLGQGVVGTTALRREGMIVNDYSRSPHAIPPFRGRDWAVLAQPLLRGPAVHGVILVRRGAAGRPFNEADLVQLGDFAVQASIALENARLLRLAAARAERVKAAAEVGHLLASTRHADRILDLIAEKCREILGAEGFGLFRLDPDGRLRYARGFGLDEAFMREHTLALGEGVVGRAARERRAVETADLLRDPAIELSPAARARVERHGSRALVAVPIVRRDEVLGVLAVYHPPGFRVPAEETEFLETLADHAAAALDNARLFAQTRRRQETAETLAAIAQTLTGSLDLSVVLSRVAEGVRRLLRSDGGAVGLVGTDGAIRITAAVGLGAEAFRDLVVLPGQGVGGQVLACGEAFWTADYLNDPRITADFAEAVRAVGLVGELAVPVRLRAEVVGVLWAIYGRAVRITDEDVELASSLAQVVAVAIANARLYEEARQREAETRALFEVGRLIGATLDPDRVLDLIVEKVRELMRVRACGIFQLDEQYVLRYARGAGLSPAFIRELRVRVGEGTSGRCIAERAPVWSADILADPGFPLDSTIRALVAQEGYRAVLSVPILIKEAPFASLATYWWEPHTPTPGEIETLSSLAALAAVALENARLYGETRGHVERLERLNQLNRAVSASLRLDEVLAKVAEAAATFFGAPLVTLWVADEEQRTLTRRAGFGDTEYLARIPGRLAYGESVPGWVAEHRQPLLDVSVADDPRVLNRELVLSRGITALSGVPVLLGDRLLGVLAIGGRRESPLAPEDVALLRTLIGQAAIAIENARLYEDAQQQEAEAVALADASRRFSATLRREEVLDSLVHTISRLLGEGWSVLPVDPHRGPTVAPSGSPAPGGDRRRHASPGLAPLAGQVAATGAPLLLRDAGDLPGDHPARPEVERLGIRSALLVPLVAGGIVAAVLVGSVREGSRQFTERDLRLAQSLADRAARVLENVQLFEELTRAYQEVQTAQEHLVQTEKLRALGEMASGVAHDFNNILAAILGRVQLMLTRVEDPTLQRWLEVVEQAALDGAQTVRRIQEFTRIRRDEPTETVDLTEIVRDAVEMTRTRWRDEAQSRGLEIHLTTQLEPVPAVDGQPAELRQALTNLILNAVDALPQGGAITVATRVRDGAVEVSVADTGVGMPEAVRRRIFEPFFTTKGPKGTGLGLAMVYGIVSRHGGQVAVESRPDAGSTFTIRLPVGLGWARGEAAPPAVRPGAGARVLLIEDEERVRDTLADMLRLANNEVVVASQGAEGLERFQAEPFDLVITDLAMPGMSGWQVAQAVKTLRPEVPVVLVTGWGVELPAEQLRANGVDRVMTKPIRFDDVREVVARFRSRIPPPR